MPDGGLAQALAAMQARGVDPRAQAAFERFYGILARAETGYLHEDDIAPLREVPHLDEIEVDDAAQASALATTVVVKLNGGLGTSMGMTGPKSTLPVRDGLSFLDVTARQILALRRRHGVELPLLLMDSEHTRGPSLAVLSAYPDLPVEGVPADFLQSTEPRLRADDLTPVQWPTDPELEWCPPGHGDVYIALQSSGILITLQDRGFRYLFLSNADNLGATCEPRIPAYMAAHGIPYVAEVTERTRNDRKGGHLAVRRADGRLVLRDSAQVAPDDEDAFQDVTRHSLFHVNNLWIDLTVLTRELTARDGVLPLPIIVNRKIVDPAVPDSPRVVQLESAMGAAVEVFDGARALQVPRSRFRPVKTTNELLLLRSDIYRLDDDYRVESLIDHAEPFIDLGGRYRLIADFEERFAQGAPSLRQADSLTIAGEAADAVFGRDIVVQGATTIVADVPVRVPDGMTVTGVVKGLPAHE